MKVGNAPGRDDFGVRKSVKSGESREPFPPHAFDLVVSERALDVLKALGLSNATITPREPDDDQGSGN